MITNSIFLFELIILLIFALGWGSFSTMAVYRLSHNEPWIGKRPYCTECGHHLKFIDYISLISFFMHRGKCRYCKKKYCYHKVYFVTELLVLIFFLINYYISDFSEIFIVNSGFIIAAVIWSIVYYTHQINLNKMLIAMLFFAALKRTLIDDTIYVMFYGGVASFIISLAFRHLYFACQKKHGIAMDYLEYKADDRFKADNFIIIKLSIICGIMLGFSKILFVTIIPILLIMLCFKSLKYSLPIMTNLMILIALL